MSSIIQLSVDVWGETDRGRVRELNEDSLYYPTKQTQGYPPPNPAKLREKGYLLIVADGIGGSTAGQEASREVVRALRSIYYESPNVDPGKNLSAAVGYANDSLYQMRARNPALGSTGSTVVAGVIHENKLHLANVGDSRAYLIRGGKAYQSTKDHTVVQEKTDRNLPVTEQDQSVITRSMGAAASVPVDLFAPIPLQNGDTVLLCSDGLSDLVSADEIGQVASSNSPQRAARKLIKMANSRGGHDNITAIVAIVGQQAAPSPLTLTKRQLVILAGLFVLGVLILAIAGIALLSRSQRTLPTATPLFPLAGTGTPVSMPTATATGAHGGKVTSTPVWTVTPVSTAGKATSPQTPDGSGVSVPTLATPMPCPYNKQWNGIECVCPEGTKWEDLFQWCVDTKPGRPGKPPDSRD
jgi:serine/threonine protein phosphatase PrpC